MVIAVIGILAAGVLAVIDPIAQMQKGADGRRKSDLKQIQTGLELYRSDCGRYPAASSNSVPTTLTSSSPTVSGPCPSIGVTYMQRVPQDPKYGRYVYSPTGGGYTLSACAEKPSPSDPDVVNSNVVTGCTSGKNFRYYSP